MMNIKRVFDQCLDFLKQIYGNLSQLQPHCQFTHITSSTKAAICVHYVPGTVFTLIISLNILNNSVG